MVGYWDTCCSGSSLCCQPQVSCAHPVLRLCLSYSGKPWRPQQDKPPVESRPVQHSGPVPLDYVMSMEEGTCAVAHLGHG